MRGSHLRLPFVVHVWQPGSIASQSLSSIVEHTEGTQELPGEETAISFRWASEVVGELETKALVGQKARLLCKLRQPRKGAQQRGASH